MQKTGIIFILLILAVAVRAQDQTQSKALPRFNKIVASPRINVVLQKGDQESIRIVCSNVSASKVNVFVTGKKLRIYLDHARVVEQMERVNCDLHGHRDGHHKRSIYRDVNVTAYVTYRELKEIEVRGEQELTVNDEISSDKLKLRAYGEAEITLASLNTRKFKVSLYGENHLTVHGGATDHQVYRLFGENKIDTKGLSSTSASTRIYGEGRLSLTASRELVINAIGEPVIRVNGSPHINRGIVLGRADIYGQ